MNKTKSNLIEEKNTTILKLTLILDKLFTVLDDFRQNLTQFQNSCKCIENLKNRLNFSELEDDYKSITEEYNQNKAIIDEELGITCDYIQETSAEPTVELTTTPVTVRRLKTKDIFDCEYEDCNYKTWCMSSMRKHMNYLHLNKSRIKCKDCDYQCWGSHRLKEHIKTTHSESYACPYDDCNNTYFSEWNIQKHIDLVHKNKSKLSCNECQFKCWRIAKLRSHQMDVHNRIFTCLLNTKKKAPNKKKNSSINSYECFECGHRYRRKAQLSNHIKLYHKKVNESKYFQNFVYKFPHKRVFHNKKIVCTVCFKVFSSYEEKRRHINISHPNNQKNRYIDSHYLRKHLNTISLENSCVDSNDINCLLDQTIDLRPEVEALHNDLKCSLNSNKLIETQIIERFPTETVVSINEDNDQSLDKRDDNFVFGSNLVNKLRQQTIIKTEPLTSSEPQMISNNSDLKTNNCQTSVNCSQMLPKLKIYRRRAYKKAVRCDECDFSTDRKMILSEHKKLHHSKYNYQCLHCKLTFRGFDQLMIHSSNCVNVFVCDKESCFFQTTESFDFEEHRKSHSSDVITKFIDNIECEVVLSEPIVDNNGFIQTLRPLLEDVIERNDTSVVQQISNKPKDMALEKVLNQMSNRNENNCQTSVESIAIKCEPQDVESFEEEIIERNETSNTRQMNTESQKEIKFDNPSNGLLETIIGDNYQSNIDIKSQCLELESSLLERKTIKTNETSFVAKISNLNQLTEELTNSCGHNSSENGDQIEDNINLEDKESSKTILPSLNYNKTSGRKLFKNQSSKKRDNNSKNSDKNDKNSDKKFNCDKCQYKTHVLTLYRMHLKSKHQIYDCPHCSTVCVGFNEIREHRLNFHDSIVEQQFKCDLSDCRFECNDSQLFSEHKRNHLNENIDKIITEFQFGIKRVEIKTEIEEQNTIFVDPNLFLAQNSGQTLSISGASNETNDKSNNFYNILLNNSSKQSKTNVPNECQSSSGTGKRLRGLNSAREPIRLPSKSTKKISELFKK